jgi:hypothetical protein
MVLRRVTPHSGDGPRLLAAFRRTRQQALGHGLFLGTVVGSTLLVVGGVAALIRNMAAAAEWPHIWLWLLVALILPLVIGGLIGTAIGGRTGVDADDLGIHSVPPLPRSFGPWSSIVDIRAERRRSRTIVAIYLESGAVLRLRAPYDGKLLGRDPRFERKYFTLLNLWETHRNWRSRT